jgi:glycosyltransferase involved in cell wall biosynthesis
LVIIYDGVSPDHVLSVDSVLGKPSNNKIPILFYFTKEKSGIGPGGARNLGIKFAKGKYITFVDDDDEISINYSKLIKLLDSSDIPLIVGEFSHKNECFSRKYNESEKKNKRSRIYKKT